MVENETDNLEQLEFDQVISCDSLVHNLGGPAHTGNAEWYASVECSCGRQIRAWCDKFVKYFEQHGINYIYCAKCLENFKFVKVLDRIKK